MRPSMLFRLRFVSAFVLAALVMASCAVPTTTDQTAPAQPPVTVLVVVTATSAQPAVMQITAVATTKPAAVIEPTATFTVKPAVLEATPTSTSKPSTVQPTSTSTSKPPTLQPTATQTRTPAPTPTQTRTATPPPSATPAPHTRTLYSKDEFIKTGSPIGDKGDTTVNVLRLLPAGCEIVDVKAVDFHLPHEIQMPPEITAEHRNLGKRGHGWTLARTSTDPRDLGVKLHWWYDITNMIDLLVVYTVREPWNVDCNVPGLTKLQP